MPREARDFQAELLDWKEIHEIPDGWPPARLLALLDRLEVEGVSESDAREMALLALQDHDPDDAAEIVLESVFGDAMRAGVRQNLAHDLSEERPWEDFADISQQAGIFAATVLLHGAFPRAYGTPDAVRAIVRVDSESGTGRAWLDAAEPDPGLLLRILAAGMDDRAVLRRLFGESLRGTRFPEAAGILWRVGRAAGTETARDFTLFSSHQWLDPLRGLDAWTATAWPDAG